MTAVNDPVRSDSDEGDEVPPHPPLPAVEAGDSTDSDEDSDNDDEDVSNEGGYQALPQDPDGFVDQQQHGPRPAESVEAERQRQLEEVRERDRVFTSEQTRDIELTDERVADIKRVMAGVKLTLPQQTPPWAGQISDQDMAERVKKKKDTNCSSDGSKKT